MRTGKILWYQESKGYGFITDDETGNNLLFHAKDLGLFHPRMLKSGQGVEFEMCVNGWTAVSIHPSTFEGINGRVHSQS